MDITFSQAPSVDSISGQPPFVDRNMMAAAAVYAKNKLTDDGIANKKSTGMRFQDYGLDS
jgi:hypothetical protein